MKLYSVMIRLYEPAKHLGNPFMDAGPYRDKAKAERALEQAKEEWHGPNVEDVYLAEDTVKDDA